MLGTCRFARAPAASLAPVPPSASARSVIPVMLPPVIDTLADDCCAMLPETSAAVTMMAPLLALTRSTMAMD